MAELRRALPGLLVREGGLVDNENDPGGLTNLGISKRAYPELSDDVIRKLTPKKVAAIYDRDYWTKLRLREISNQATATVLFDFAVHSGKVRAVLEAQRLVGVHDDGRIGPVTLASINNFDPFRFVSLYHMRRVRYWYAITARRQLRGFLRGWLRRLGILDDEVRPLLDEITSHGSERKLDK